jgi:hypothetical protein
VKFQTAVDGRFGMLVAKMDDLDSRGNSAIDHVVDRNLGLLSNSLQIGRTLRAHSVRALQKRALSSPDAHALSGCSVTLLLWVDMECRVEGIDVSQHNVHPCRRWRMHVRYQAAAQLVIAVLPAPDLRPS